jgi:surfactin synthase thioesterase subunit
MRRSGPLICFTERPAARVRLFCVPYAGGGPAAFRAWPGDLGEEIEMWAAELPGRGRRLGEPPLSSIASATDELEDGVEPLLDRPYAVFGHSMGAILGYELVQRLVRVAPPPVHLFVSGCGAPERFAQLQRFDTSTEEALVEAVWQMGTAPPAVLADPEVRAIFLPILRADLMACERYQDRGGPPLPCPITVLAGDSDELVPAEALAGWEGRGAAGVRTESFPGGHFFVEDRREAVTKLVRSVIIDQ